MFMSIRQVLSTRRHVTTLRRGEAATLWSHLFFLLYFEDFLLCLLVSFHTFELLSLVSAVSFCAIIYVLLSWAFFSNFQVFPSIVCFVGTTTLPVCLRTWMFACAFLYLFDCFDLFQWIRALLSPPFQSACYYFALSLNHYNSNTGVWLRCLGPV